MNENYEEKIKNIEEYPNYKDNKLSEEKRREEKRREVTKKGNQMLHIVSK